MFLVVGLGNPGNSYSTTRHNFGFMAIDFIAKSQGCKFFEKFSGLIAETSMLDNKVILAKPQNFMNLSGNLVSAICAYYKIKPSNVCVLHDDLEVDFGKIKIKFSGGAGGHNGLRSIDSMIGKDYWRIRLGIGRPSDSRISVSDFVLSNFSSEEISKIDEIYSDIISSVTNALFTKNL